MKIIVGIKQVPLRDSTPKIAAGDAEARGGPSSGEDVSGRAGSVLGE